MSKVVDSLEQFLIFLKVNLELINSLPVKLIKLIFASIGKSIGTLIGPSLGFLLG